MHPIRRMAAFLKPYRVPAIIAPLLMMVEVAVDLMLPYLMGRIIDVGIGTRNLPAVLNTGLLMVGLAFVGAVGGIGCTIFAVQAAMSFGADLRSAIYRKIQSLSFGNLDRLGTGQLVTRLTNDVNQVQDAVMLLLRILVRTPLLAVGSVIMAVVTSPLLAPLLAVLVPLLTAVLVIVIRRSSPLFLRVQASLDRLNTTLQENLAGVRVVKAFVRGDHEEERFGQANAALMGSSIRAMQFTAVVGPFMMLAINFGVAGALWFGGVEVTRGNITVGEIVAFTNYLRQTLFALQMVSMLLIQLTRAGASTTRLAEVLDAVPDVQERSAAPDGALAAAYPAGRIAFEHVTFAYDGGDPVLQDISFTAEPGQTVAILGATGSGKSSLVGLIPRFYDVQAGRVTIGGVDVRDLRLAALRDRIGVALQDTVLFSGTLAENIRQGRSAAPDDALAPATAVAAAAAAAQAEEFIVALPQGYDALVGQRGVNLSGGQKQRIAIARALIRQPDVLILDDSTSAVDVETEAKIQAALEAQMPGQIRIVVSQRISTVLRADKILVLDDGRLAAAGTHAELLAASPIYREIYESQLGSGPSARASNGRVGILRKDANSSSAAEEAADDVA